MQVLLEARRPAAVEATAETVEEKECQAEIESLQNFIMKLIKRAKSIDTVVYLERELKKTTRVDFSMTAAELAVKMDVPRQKKAEHDGAAEAPVSDEQEVIRLVRRTKKRGRKERSLMKQVRKRR